MTLSFTHHIQQLVEIKLYNKVLFVLWGRRLIVSPLMAVLDYGDVIYMHASSDAYICWILSLTELWDSLQLLKLLLSTSCCTLRLGGLLCDGVNSTIHKAILALNSSYLLTTLSKKRWKVSVWGAKIHSFFYPKGLHWIWKNNMVTSKKMV